MLEKIIFILKCAAGICFILAIYAFFAAIGYLLMALTH
jgi:hypothetical protein